MRSSHSGYKVQTFLDDKQVYLVAFYSMCVVMILEWGKQLSPNTWVTLPIGRPICYDNINCPWSVPIAIWWNPHKKLN